MEDLYEKYVLKSAMDKEIAEYNHSIRVTELLSKIQFLEAELNELKKRKN